MLCFQRVQGLEIRAVSQDGRQQGREPQARGRIAQGSAEILGQSQPPPTG